MSKGSSGKKQNNAAKRNRARYKLMGTKEANKARKAEKEAKRQQKLLKKGKGELTPKAREKAKVRKAQDV